MAEEIRSFYREYREGRLTRRGFLKKLSLVTGSAAAAAALLPVIESNELMAAKEAGKNQALVTEFVNYPAATGNMRAFMARPKKGKKFPAVIVIHENRPWCRISGMWQENG